MKKDRMFELMTELRDRQFSLLDCYNVFNAIDWYLTSRQEYLENVNTEYQESKESQLESAKMELHITLFQYQLDYTTDEFNTED